ncbi:MAG: murein transglycosylase [Desulfobacteraceae bacterium]|nr:MAG: murein transglycosylase [Desulfobacteraceae bacterium]
MIISKAVSYITPINGTFFSTSLRSRKTQETISYLLKTSVLLIACCFTLFFYGCFGKILKPVPESPALVKLSSYEYPEFIDDTYYDNLEEGIRQSLSYLNKRPRNIKFAFGQDLYETTHMVDSLVNFLEFIENKPSANELKKHIDENYYVYKSTGTKGSGDVLFTGYYEPFLEGSLVKRDTYKYPVYGIPPDLISIDLSLFSPKYSGEKITGRYTGQTVVPYYDRKEIETGGILDGKAPVLAWVNNPVDLFFLQIQGSGKIFLDNGETINVHYHAENGHSYKSIGNLLIQNQIIPPSEMSMQKIRAYLDSRPEAVQEILNYNPSYIFFKTEEDGPKGYLDVKLTPERSVALDRRIFPLAGLVYIEAAKPVVSGNGAITGWTKNKKFVLNQDTGGAIRGPGRADIFWGNGKYAETAAGNMKHKGCLYFLILKPESVLKPDNE